MQIKRARSMGFCFGVVEAINICNSLINRKEKKYILGMLVHNKHVSQEMRSKGFEIISEDDLLNDRDEIEENDIVVIRAHGTSKEVIEKLVSRKAQIVDATCIFVDKIKKEVQKASLNNYKILFVGDKNHPEVKGIISYADNIEIFEDYETAKNIEIDPKINYFLSTQTTLNRKKFEEIKEYFSTYPNIKIYDKICGATSIRQIEAEKLAKEVDKVIVIGDRKSSNTKKLYDVAKAINQNTYFVEDIKDLEQIQLENKDVVGITAGASTPENIIKKIENHIRGIFNA